MELFGSNFLAGVWLKMKGDQRNLQESQVEVVGSRAFSPLL